MAACGQEEVPDLWWQEPVWTEVVKDGPGPPHGLINQAKQLLPAADLAQPPTSPCKPPSPSSKGTSPDHVLRSIQGSEPLPGVR